MEIDMKQLKSDINSMTPNEFTEKYKLNIEDLRGLTDEELATRAQSGIWECLSPALRGCSLF